MAQSPSQVHTAESASAAEVGAFVARWGGADGSESANYGLFVQELCRLLRVPEPDPASEDTRDNAYVFQRRVTFRHGDGSESYGFIDCYRRDAFVLEAKKFRKLEGKAFNDAMLRARGQAEQYARSLPAAEGRPPFLMVVDVGNAIELYAEFTRSGATYTPFPDPRSHRIRLDDLHDPAQREKLRQVWLDPVALDPSRRSAKVTREIAAQLAKVAKVLETSGHDPELVAGFLTRCLFSMFAEDVGLLPARAFSNLLESLKENPAQFVPLVGEMWQAMDAGHFSVALRADVLKFNGKLFKTPQVLPLDRDQIALLQDAAKFDWKEVEPAIFGTLLERALDPEERHKLGAHYTPRAYVERLVLPTVMEPLRADWNDAQAAALLLAAEGKLDEARKEVHAFHHKLCEVRVLDPACGSGNFLYVTLEHLKRLEGEVLNQLEAFGEGQARLDMSGVTVDPHQLLGIELNPRAAAISEVVLWIGYLQWHFRTRGNVMPPQPVLKDFRNVECRDAVLAYDRMGYATDDRGVPVSRWDGKTMKKHPVTGEDVPDETARVPLERYFNPRKAQWPKADFVVGNPPFIGSGSMRDALGDGYTEALRGAWPEVPESADFVMYWWNHAADRTRTNELRRFGLITTNSLRQTFNRRVIERHMAAKPPLSIAFAISDHPWVDSADGAAVRIAMTAGTAGNADGTLLVVTDEQDSGDDVRNVVLVPRMGRIHADLTIGANVAAAGPLVANSGISSPGVKLHGSGFIVTAEEAINLGLGKLPNLENHILTYRNGRDLTDTPRNVMVIDLFDLNADEVRRRYPSVYQWVLERVKPERDQNNRATYRDNWWIFGEPRRKLRPALYSLQRYIATVETAKHRPFQFLNASILPDNMLIAIGIDNAHFLGVLSSKVHVTWALAAGGTLEDRPRYNKTRCFETFPFPVANEAQQNRIRDLGEQLDARRKRQQALHPDLTLTGMYNVLGKLKSGEALTTKEKVIHEQGLVSVLKQLHDELDLAVLEAYGWSDLAPLMQVFNGNTGPGTNSTPATRDDCKAALDNALLERLVALNAERAAEEKKGLIRWLRPEFQNPEHAAVAKPPPAIQAELNITDEEDTVVATATIQRLPWPKELPDQVRQVADVLAAAREPMSLDAIAGCFTGKGPWKRRLPQIVDTLEALGRARRVGNGVYSHLF
jgi:hypothetical protein